MLIAMVSATRRFGFAMRCRPRDSCVGHVCLVVVVAYPQSAAPVCCNTRLVMQLITSCIASVWTELAEWFCCLMVQGPQAGQMRTYIPSSVLPVNQTNSVICNACLHCVRSLDGFRLSVKVAPSFLLLMFILLMNGCICLLLLLLLLHCLLCFRAFCSRIIARRHGSTHLPFSRRTRSFSLYSGTQPAHRSFTLVLPFSVSSILPCNYYILHYLLFWHSCVGSSDHLAP